MVYTWKRLILPMLLALSCAIASSACSSENEELSSDSLSAIADKVWSFSQLHPDGFTLDIRTMTEPAEGIAVSYAATQNSHSRNQLEDVVRHALEHEGYVGGWYNRVNGLYYFDSTRLFPENALPEAIQFGKDNSQQSVFIL